MTAGNDPYEECAAYCDRFFGPIGEHDAAESGSSRALIAEAFARLFVIDYHGRGACYHIADIVRSRGADGLRVWGIDYAQMLLRDDHERLLHEAGFAKVDFHGSYSFESYDKEHGRRLITVAGV